MKISFSTLACPDYNVDELITAATTFNYNGIELRAVESTIELWNVPDFTTAQLEKTKNKFHNENINIVTVDTSISFALADTKHQMIKLDEGKKYLEIASGLDCPYIRVFGGPIADYQSIEECIKWNIDGYNKLIEIADTYNISLLFETHDDFSKSTDILPLITSLDGNVGIVWDILHPYRFGEKFEDTYNNLKSYIKHIHIKDSHTFSSKAFDIALVGEGNVPIIDVVNILENNKYDGYYSFEWEKLWHPEIQNADISLPHYVNYMKHLL